MNHTHCASTALASPHGLSLLSSCSRVSCISCLSTDRRLNRLPNSCMGLEDQKRFAKSHQIGANCNSTVCSDGCIALSNTKTHSTLTRTHTPSFLSASPSLVLFLLNIVPFQLDLDPVLDSFEPVMMHCLLLMRGSRRSCSISSR